MGRGEVGAADDCDRGHDDDQHPVVELARHKDGSLWSDCLATPVNFADALTLQSYCSLQDEVAGK